MSKFDLGIPDNFDYGLGYIEEANEDFFTKFARGEWKDLIDERIYQKMVTWFKAHSPEKDVVVRFEFMEIEKQKRFAIYAVCFPVITEDLVAIHTVHVPLDESFEDKNDHILLAIPQPLLKKPLFNVPSDALIGVDDDS